MDDSCWYMVTLQWWLVAVIPLVECGLLESFQPKDGNPVELNEFLTNVLDHQNDFNYVKDVAKRYQNSRPQRHQQQLQLPSSFEYGSARGVPLKLYPKISPYNLHAKRHAHNYHALKKRLKSLDHMQNKQRHRRHIKQGLLDEISERDNGGGGGEIMKKDVMDFASAVHKTNKVHKHTDNGLSNDGNGNNNMYYVDLEGKRDDNNDRDDEKRSDSEQATSGSSSSNSEANNIKNSKLEMVESGEAAAASSSSTNNDEGSKLMKSEHDNTVDDTNYLVQQQQQHINDNSGFEKALSYEIEPSANKPQKNYDNPGIVKANGADKSIVQQSEDLPPAPASAPADKYQQNFNVKLEKIPEQHHYPVPPEKYSENAMKQIPNIENIILDTGKQAVDASKPNTIVKHIGDSFIEIDKQRRDDAEERSFNQNEENSLKDRREDLENFENEEAQANVPRSRIELLEKERFQGRKLQFFDEAMINFDDGDDEKEYENFPVGMRPRRDFLDALGMKNEEDYSEDNPYKEDLKVNNTDVNNDTNIHKQQSTQAHSGGCLVPGKTTTGTTTTTKKPQSEIDNIKQILEEPKEAASDNTVGSFKKEKQEKRAKKTQYSKIEDFDDIVEGEEGSKKMRQLRQVNEIEDKILQNKDKIFKYDPGKQTDCKAESKKTREERNNVAIGDWNKNTKKKKKKNAQQHHINKKEDSEESTTVQATTGFQDPANVTELETNNSTYEQVAHQMDLENEKLAQVVNGRFASKIVTSVFKDLKKKSALKTKFFSGLSRKHMNYDGNIEVDIFKENETEGVDEARLLLDQITKVLNRLVLNQVRRKLCQRLPDDLKEYLRTIVNVKNPIEVAGFVPNSQQGDFLFAYQQNEAAGTPPFNLRKLQETLVNLEGLLLSYHNLNADCQEKAQPVKDYIERHVKMLRKIVACPDHSCEKPNEGGRKRDAVPVYNGLIEKQLESVGLGQKNRFIPNFDVDAIVKSKMGHSSDKRAAPPGRKTEKFRKLQLAAERVRQKRENERKIGELFGGMRKNKRSADEFEEPVVYSLGS